MTVNHQKNLTNYAYELVQNYSKIEKTDEFYTLAVYDVPVDEREELCRLYLEAKDRDLDLIMEGVRNADFKIDSEYNCALLAMLKNNNQENREHFAHTVISNVLTYCEEGLQEVIDQACAEYDADREEVAKYGDPDAETY
jgi:hypothetical protein